MSVDSNEYMLSAGMTIISHTDNKGIITRCNEDFIEAAGYSAEELIGKPHNILRHSDMPAEAFRDLWHTVQRGRPWSGIVKNKRKDGRYYWVRATVTPLPDGSGFTSVRTLPKPEEIKAAEALYTRMRGGEKIKLHEGRIAAPTSSLNFLNKLSIAQRLWLMAVLPAVISICLLSFNLLALKQSNIGMQEIYSGSLIPAEKISKINDLNQMTLVDLLLAEEALAKQESPAKNLEAIRSNKKELDGVWDEYLPTIADAKEKLLADEHLAKRVAMWGVIDDAATALAKGDADRARQKVHEQLDAVRWAQEESIDKLLAYQSSDAKARADKNAALYSRDLLLSIIFGAIGILFPLFLASVSVRYISRTLRQTGDTSLAIAKGDLTQPTPHANEDELGKLVSAVAIMRNSQHELIASLRKNSEKVARHSEELAAAARSGSEASTHQAEAVSSMAAAIEQLSASIHAVEDSAHNASEASRKSAVISSEGGRVVHESADEMAQITAAVNTTGESIKELEQMTLQIAEIVNSIRDIADQTNLLALNAAIEAARAGEQGRGFAVVADEVRKLAERTAQSTLQINEVANKIQSGTHKAVQDIEAAVTRAKVGVDHAHKAGDSVVSIRSETEQVSIAINEITNALEEQASASSDISHRIERVAFSAEENSASSVQTSTSAQELERLAAHLQSLTAYFKI